MDSQRSDDPIQGSGQMQEVPANPQRKLAPPLPTCPHCTRPFAPGVSIASGGLGLLFVFFCSECGAVINCAIPPAPQAGKVGIPNNRPLFRGPQR